MTVVSGLTGRNAALTKYADTVYGDGPNGLAVDGQTPLRTSNDLMPESSQTGFFGAVYQYPGTDKFVIAFRGTDGLEDVFGVDAALANGTWHPQLDNAIDFVAKAAQALGIPPDQIKDRIIVTGHSSGGAEAQIVGRLFGCDGATFDPAGGARQTQLVEFRQAAERVGIDPAANEVPDTFRNYAVDGSAVSGTTGAHVGQVETIPQASYPNLIDLLTSAGLAALAGNPLVMFLGVALTDQFAYKHPIGQVADTLNRLASLEDDPFINSDGSEIRVTKLDDGAWQVYDQGGQELGSFKLAGGALQLTTADGQLVQISSDGAVSYGTPYGSGAQTLTNLLTNGTLIDALSLLRALQTGEPLPVLASGLRLANDLSNLNNMASLELSGASQVASGVLSLLSLEAALQRGDTLAAVTAGAQALSFGAQAYADFAMSEVVSAWATDTVDLAAEAAALEAQALASTLGKALPYLNIVNSLAHGDAVGAAVAAISIEFPPVGIAYAVFNIVTSLFGDDDAPEPWGSGRFVWEGGGVGVSVVGEAGGEGAVSGVMNQVRETLDQLIDAAQDQNPAAPLGLIPNRLPGVSYGTDGYRYTDIDPLTGVERNPSLRFDTSGRPYNAAAGSPEAFRNLTEALLHSALSRGAIAPAWEEDTARAQTQAGDPQAGLTEEERAGRAGQLAAPVTGSRQTWRPVALDLDGDGIETQDQITAQAVFDVDDSGFLKNTGWLSSDDAFLVLDRNSNGRIDSGRELFSNGAVALERRGLAGLAWVDGNGDGKLNYADPVFSELRLWRDADGHGQPDAGELTTLNDLGIAEIDYALGRYTRNGQLRQLGSPDLQADAEGSRVNVVPEGILIESSGGQVSLIVTGVRDLSQDEDSGGSSGEQDGDSGGSQAEEQENEGSSQTGGSTNDTGQTGGSSGGTPTGDTDSSPAGDTGSSGSGSGSTGTSSGSTPPSTPPQLVPGSDGVTVYEDLEAVIASSLLLANDSFGDTSGQDLTITSASGFTYGSGWLDGNGSVHYLAEANYYGPASFTYTVQASDGQSTTATVEVTVENVNDAPTVSGVSHTTWPIYGYSYQYWDEGGVHGGEPIYQPYMELWGDFIWPQIVPLEPAQLTSPAWAYPSNYHVVSIAQEDTGAGRVSATDVDDAAGSLRYEIVGQPQWGAVSVSADGSFQYTGWQSPNQPSAPLRQGDEERQDSFQVRISDPGGGSTTETVSVTHYGSYYAPSGGGDGGKPIAIDLDGNGFDFIDVDDSNVFFDVNGDGWKHRMAWVAPGDGLLTFGARQGSCRLIHAAKACLSVARDVMVTTESRSGLRVTAPMGDQLRVWRDQRAGLRARAWVYSA